MMIFIAVVVVLTFIFITLNEMGRVASMKALAERLGETEESLRRIEAKLEEINNV